MDGLPGDGFADGNDGHSLQDMVKARAYGDRGSDHTRKDRAGACGLVSGFDGVQDVDYACFFAGPGDLNIDIYEGAGRGDNVTNVVYGDIEDMVGEAGGVGQLDVMDGVSGEFQAHGGHGASTALPPVSSRPWGWRHRRGGGW